MQEYICNQCENLPECGFDKNCKCGAGIDNFSAKEQTNELLCPYCGYLHDCSEISDMGIIRLETNGESEFFDVACNECFQKISVRMSPSITHYIQASPVNGYGKRAEKDRRDKEVEELE